MLRGPTGRVAGTAGRIGEYDLCTLATAKTFVWPETRWDTLANCELDVFNEVHMDDLHASRPRPALDLIQTNLSQKIQFKIWTVYEVGMKYEHLKREHT